MTLGNITALKQENVKRMLAYSSIGHAGYLLLGLIAVGSAPGDEAVLRHGLIAVPLYLIIYTFGNAGAFAVVALLRKNGEVAERVEDFNGLIKRHPAAATAMLIFLLSLAGIPCTAGFIGKWWLFGAAIRVPGLAGGCGGVEQRHLPVLLRPRGGCDVHEGRGRGGTFPGPCPPEPGDRPFGGFHPADRRLPATVHPTGGARRLDDREFRRIGRELSPPIMPKPPTPAKVTDPEEEPGCGKGEPPVVVPCKPLEMKGL